MWSPNYNDDVPSFKFNQLDYNVYIRFIELLNRENIRSCFTFTNKQNYIKCVERYGIKVFVCNGIRYTRPFSSPYNAYLNIQSEEEYENFLNIIPGLRNYVVERQLRVFIDTYKKSRQSPALDYSEIDFSGIESTDDIDILAEHYFRESVQYIFVRLKIDSLDDAYSMIKHFINKMPTAEYGFNFLGYGSLELFMEKILLIKIPSCVVSIQINLSMLNFKYHTIIYKDKKWFLKDSFSS